MSSIQERIKSTIKEFKKLSAELEDQNVNTSLIKQAIQKFEAKSCHLAGKGQKDCERGKEQRGIHAIFDFYAKQHKAIKSKVTFQEYLHENDGIHIGDFLVFCRDFQISAKNPLSKPDLMKIFKVSCSFKKEMNESEFALSLQHLANKLFSLSPKENLLKFFDFIHIDNLEYIHKTAKGTRLAFSSEKLNFRSSIQKIKLPSEKNLPRVSQIPGKRYMSNQQFHKRKKRAMIPRDAIATSIKKNSYSSNLFKKLNPMTFAWQTLTSLNTDQYSTCEKLADLVINNASDDKILEEYYGSLCPSTITEQIP